MVEIVIKKTENLERQWRNQREQMIEEREYTQSGKRRSPQDVAIVDHDIRVLDALIALRLGTKFDAREIEKRVRSMNDG